MGTLRCAVTLAIPVVCGGTAVSDEPRKAGPVDAGVVAMAHGDGTMNFAIGLPKAVGPGVVELAWTGIFILDGKELPGTEFELVVARGWDVRAQIVGDKLPSQTVRLFAPGSRRPSAAPPPSIDEPRKPPPIDARAIRMNRVDGKLEFAIGVPKDADPNAVDVHWTGVFTADGKELPSTAFAIVSARGAMIRGQISGEKLPSDTVRLYSPGNGSALHAEEPRKAPPIDARVVAMNPVEGKLEFSIGLPKGIESHVVTVEWTGIFTADGKELTGTGFKIGYAKGWTIRGRIVGAKLPSDTVRLFSPGSNAHSQVVPDSPEPNHGEVAAPIKGREAMAANTLPSETVRLYPPGYTHSPIKAEPAGDEARKPAPVDAGVVTSVPANVGRDFSIRLPKEIGPSVVQQNWSGVFTTAGKELSGTAFKLVFVDGWAVRAHIAAEKLPSANVRLFPPEYTH